MPDAIDGEMRESAYVLRSSAGGRRKQPHAWFADVALAAAGANGFPTFLSRPDLLQTVTVPPSNVVNV